MSVNNEHLHNLIDDSKDHAAELLAHVSSLTEDPMTALISLMRVTTLLARSMDLPLDVLVSGIEELYSSIEEATHHAAY